MSGRGGGPGEDADDPGRRPTCHQRRGAHRRGLELVGAIEVATALALICTSGRSLDRVQVASSARARRTTSGHALRHHGPIHLLLRRGRQGPAAGLPPWSAANCHCPRERGWFLCNTLVKARAGRQPIQHAPQGMRDRVSILSRSFPGIRRPARRHARAVGGPASRPPRPGVPALPPRDQRERRVQDGAKALDRGDSGGLRQTDGRVPRQPARRLPGQLLGTRHPGGIGPPQRGRLRRAHDRRRLRRLHRQSRGGRCVEGFKREVSRATRTPSAAARDLCLRRSRRRSLVNGTMSKLDLRAQPHRRFNPLTRDWVLISPSAPRGLGWQVENASPTKGLATNRLLPLPGNARAGGARNPRYRGAFAFDNDFAACCRGLLQLPGTRNGSSWRAGAGICRVICFSPRHDLSLSRMAHAAVRACRHVGRAAAGTLPADCRYVQIFETAAP